MNMNRDSQRGAILITSLLMLVVLTLLAVSSIRISNVNLLIVGNMQAEKRAQELAERGISDILSDPHAFITTPAQQRDIIAGGVVVGNVSARQCIASRTAPGYSIVWGSVAPEDTSWEFSATADNSGGGATATIHQGVDLRLTVGNCQ